MQTGYVLLATIALPLFVAILLLAVPSKRPDLVRYISIATGFALFGLSAYAFFAYQLATADAYQFELQWAWIENVGFWATMALRFTSASMASVRPWCC